jgi:hypothetical protein
VTQGIQGGRATVKSGQPVEVKVGSGSVIVEQSELQNLIDAISEMRNLAADGITVMNIGSA